MGGTERAERDVVGPEAAPSGPELPTALQIGHAFDPAEKQADEVADRVLQRIRATETGEASAPGGGMEPLAHVAGPTAAPGAGVQGGAAGAEVEAGVAAARGKGSSLDAGAAKRLSAAGVSTSGVGVHTGSNADALCQAVGARAFTVGSDIFFASGQYRPDTDAGMHLIAHEVAHTQESGEALRCSVRRRLAGTAKAAEDLGGKANSGAARAIAGKRKNWDLVLRGLRDYEQLEKQVDGKPIEKFLATQPKMITKLVGVQNSMTDWREANNDAANENFAEEVHATGVNNTLATSDNREKAARRQAIGLLEPRVGAELSLLNDPNPAVWMDSAIYNDSARRGAGPNLSGGKNPVREQIYDDGNKGFAGFFKADRGFADNSEGHELDSGIRQLDPRYGARAVAMSRLDRLLNAGVTARAEFAIQKDKSGKSVLGTVLESAKGKAAEHTTFAIDKDHAAALGEGVVALDDPVLQQGLNKLQILDAIAGQLDRHHGNYTIATDKDGNVTGVTGIDLDMSFGKDMKTHDQRTFAPHYRSLPPVIDAELGRAILAIDPRQIEQILYGLLPEAEIAAAVGRFVGVKAAVDAADKAGELREDWSSDVSRGERLAHESANFSAAQKSYAHVVGASAAGKLPDLLRGRIEQTLGDPSYGEIDSGTVDALMMMPKDVLALLAGIMSTPAVLAPLAQFVWDQGLTVDDVDRLVEIICDLSLGGKAFDKFVVDVQEAELLPVLAQAAETLGKPIGADTVKTAIARFGTE